MPSQHLLLKILLNKLVSKLCAIRIQINPPTPAAVLNHCIYNPTPFHVTAEIASLMQELAEGLGEEEEQQQQHQEAAAATAAWRACYISRQVPAPQLGPVALKAAPGACHV
jgi:hypothetical protein